MMNDGSIAKITKEEKQSTKSKSILQLQRKNALPITTVTPLDNNNSTSSLAKNCGRMSSTTSNDCGCLLLVLLLSSPCWYLK